MQSRPTHLSFFPRLPQSYMVVLGVLLLAGAMPALAQPPSHSSRQQSPAADQAGSARRDRYGDPLPQHARSRLGTLRWRHGGRVGFVGFAAKGQQLVTACDDGYFRVWNVSDGKEVRRFGQESERRDLRDPRGLRHFTTGNNNPVALTADGITLAVADWSGMVRMWEVASGKQVASIRAREKQFGAYAGAGVAFSANGKLLAIRDPDGQIRLWDVAANKEQRKVGKARASRFAGGESLVFSPCGKLLAVSAGGDDNPSAGVIILYDPANGSEVRRLKHRGYVPALAFSSDGKVLAVDTTLYDVASGKRIRVLGSEQRGFGFASHAAFSPDGRILAYGEVFGSIQLWDVTSGRLLRSLGGSLGDSFVSPGSFAFSPDGRVLADGSHGNTVRLWQVDTAKEVVADAGHSDAIRNVALAPDGRVTTYGADRTVRDWDIRGTELHRFSFSWFGIDAANAVLSADGTLAAGTVETLAVFGDVRKGRMLLPFRLPDQRIGGPSAVGLALAPDGKTLAVRMSDRIVHVVDKATGKALRRFAGRAITDDGTRRRRFSEDTEGGLMIYSPDGATLAIVYRRPNVDDEDKGSPSPHGSEILLWAHGRGTQGRPLDVGRQGVQALAYSADGRTLAIANADDSISLCEVLTGQEYLKTPSRKPKVLDAGLGMATGWPNSLTPANLAISPDGLAIAAAGPENAVCLWDPRTGKELGRLKGHQAPILAVAFGADSRTLVSAGEDTTALVWDTGSLIKAPRRTTLDVKVAEKLWNDLAGDAATAMRAICTLGDAPQQAFPLLRERLQPAKAVPAEHIDKWIADLDSPAFQRRRVATRELEKIGEPAVPALHKALTRKPTLEMRRRVEQMLEQITTGLPAAQVRQALRAVHVLELLGGRDARAVLDRLAKGAADDRLTVHAQAALKRLQK